MRELTRRPVPPGVLAYEGADVVGWAAVAPRAELPFARSRKIPHVDDLPVWSVWCFRVGTRELSDWSSASSGRSK